MSLLGPACKHIQVTVGKTNTCVWTWSSVNWNFGVVAPGQGDLKHYKQIMAGKINFIFGSFP